MQNDDDTGMSALSQSMRESIDQLEQAMLAMPQQAMECLHHFAPGIYVRELHIPAGTTLTGAIHKHRHINIVSKGRIEVATENGTTTITAPCVFVSPPGTKRVGFAHEDTIWITCSACAADNVADAERELVTNDRDEYEALQAARPTVFFNRFVEGL